MNYHQVAEPLRAMVMGAPLEDARHLAQRYDRMRQEAEAQVTSLCVWFTFDFSLCISLLTRNHIHCHLCFWYWIKTCNFRILTFVFLYEECTLRNLSSGSVSSVLVLEFKCEHSFFSWAVRPCCTDTRGNSWELRVIILIVASRYIDNLLVK